ncbi:MAG: hypothetical protein LBH25_04355 [Fibromonadaceae bacterium]|jgi:hypothetical protein|nr:hypothetical protein [Fibromonadaceae bacterium]
MKKMFYLAILLSQVFIAVSYSEPMESYRNYNLILVHGAGGYMYGMDCANADSIYEANHYRVKGKDGKDDYLELTGGYGRKLGFDDPTLNKIEFNLDSNMFGLNVDVSFMQKREGSAEDMDIENDGLRHWLTEKVFEGDKSLAYLQRPFTNPANSPVNNARELGDPTWYGSKKCEIRRSLIEEAQEVRAKGRDNLKTYRTNPKYHYKDSLLPPSRNILIAHSMGGVTSREYVQGNGYNNDVDKIITLDSPHEGTGALNMLVEMSNWKGVLEQTAYNTISDIAMEYLLITQTGDPYIAAMALNSLVSSFVHNAKTFELGYGLIKALDKHYRKEDPLTPYIDPTRSGGINDLKNRPYTDNLPMMRLLYGTNSMTFSDASDSKVASILNFLLPKKYSAKYYNYFSQIYNGGLSSFFSFDDVTFINSEFAGFAGNVFGVTIGESGTTLIPEWSGRAKNTKAFDNPRADIMRRSYNGHVAGDMDLGYVPADLWGVPGKIHSASIAIAAADLALKYLFPELLPAVKSGIASLAVVAAGANKGAIYAAYLAGFYDLSYSHEVPLHKQFQSKWKGAPNTYSKILGDNVTVTPYQMEEFLYEKPFASVKVRSLYSSDWADQKKDTLGLYVGDSSKPVYIADKLSSPLAFKSSGDWETFGAKKERWSTTQGADGKVPIRHVDRYALPSFMVEDFIQKYEFEIDDLMPHRLRQIRLNFNFNEEIAWECDIDREETDAAACAVYKRTPAAPGWVELPNREKHPVGKNGIFEFNPNDYYSGVGLGAIQKDNQNTVVLSMVNKVGLSNSQRFYYLFKATADLAEPHWPYRNIKISKIEGFKAYISTLDYQGFAALGGKERITVGHGNSGASGFNDMSSPYVHGEGFLLDLKTNYGTLPEGKYNWDVKVFAGNGSDSTESEMFIPFTLDTTPPKISFSSEREVVNLDSISFLARFKNEDTTGYDESLRMVAFFLKKDGTSIASAKFSNVLAPNFGVSLSDFREITSNSPLYSLPDGEYKIAAYAFDGSVGNLDKYNLLNRVANGDTSVYHLFDSSGVKADIIYSKASAKFTVDMQPPEIEEFSLSRVSAGKEVSKPVYSFAENAGELIINQDSLLRIFINISDSSGKDTAVARYSLTFSEINGGEPLQMGDTILLVKGKGQKKWEEQSNMLIPDGDYEVSLKVWDEAGNASENSYAKVLRIDRLPPSVLEAVSAKLTYADTSDVYSAKIYVEQRDNAGNLSKMECHWRINGGVWNKISKILPQKSERQILEFEMDKSIVGTFSGRRRLEAGCMDWAGNFASVLDLFHVGELSPIIAYPGDSTVIGSSVMAIRGTAPKRSSDDSLASYKLEWRKSGDSDWQTSGVDVGAGKRSSDSSPWLSNGAAPSLGDLGYLRIDGFDAGSYYELKLSVKDCSACQWRSDVVSFYYWPDSDWGSGLDGLNFAVSGGDGGFIPGEDVLSLSLFASGSSGDDFRARFYAQDSKGNALFEISADTLSVSPFDGEPASFSGNGVWFWSESETYNLRWNGLPAGEELAILYASGDIGEGICGTGCSLKDTLISSNSSMDDMYKASSLQHELRMPNGLSKAMLFRSNSGNVQFKSKKAFWLSPKDIFKGSANALPVHLGKGGSALETVANFSGGFQVNPSLYGLHYEWDGIASTGRYPQGDSVVFYAEAVENMVGGKIFRDSLKVLIKKPDLSIASDTSALDDFYLVSYKGNEKDTVTLGNKTISYGIVGRDALVSAYIKDKSGNIVKTFFTDSLHSASRTDKAYSFSWNGVNDANHLVSDGDFSLYIAANEDGASSPQSASLSLNFKVHYSSGVELVKDEPGVASRSSLSLLHADSLGSDYWQYTPVADYLVKAEASGKTLPDTLRNLTIGWDAVGTQSVYGFHPQRFSLAVKRQRAELPLVIVTKVKHYIETSKSCVMYWTESDRGHYTTDSIYDKRTVYFDDTRKSSFKLSIDKRGLDESSENSVTIYAFLLRHADGKDAKGLIEDSSSAVWKETILLPKYAWIPILIAGNAKTYQEYVAYASGSDEEEFRKLNQGNLNCSADVLNGKQCIYTQEEKTRGYNPNANLFSFATLKPINSRYYTDYKNVNSNCSSSPKRFSKLDFNVELEIPTDYWNAGYGYDNLVNRTIRLDQTNKAMYGTNGYLRQVDSLTNENTFYDGAKWYKNFNYGMLTPFEVHRFPFISVDKISSNNAFAFPDEMADKYKYPSYYKAKIYNQGDMFRAQIIGTRSSNSGKYSLMVENGNGNVDKKTQLLTHGSVEIQVSLNSAISDIREKITIPYPASTNWKEDAKYTPCPNEKVSSWLEEKSNEANCRKYYDGGSKVHYTVGDFTDEDWKSKMTVSVGNRQVFANINNSTATPQSPFLKIGNQSGNTSPCATSLKIDSSKYNSQSGRFYAVASCVTPPSEVNAAYKPKISGVSGSDTALFKLENDTLYIEAQNWKDSSFWRHLDTATHHQWQDYPTHGSSQTLRIESFFNDGWVKGLKLTDAKLLHLDSSQHTHFKADFNSSDNSITLSVKPDIDPNSLRPSEFIAVKGVVPEYSDWRISYLNRGSLHSLASGRSKDSLLAWFNVNKLQGNTSILFQWGNGNVITNMRKLDLDIGRSVTLNGGGLVQSLFGEVSVEFPKNAIGDTVVTVRTANAKDYAFETLSGSALLGPVVEVLPSMVFTDTNALPRVKSRITKNELANINLSPDRVRLYKIDTENRKFVELQDTHIGFDKEDDCSPSENYAKECKTYSENWSYLLITAETRTFSAFAALDMDVAEQFNAESDIVPDKPLPAEIACTISDAPLLWLGLDNGYLELAQDCNQPAIGTLQLRKNGVAIAEASQSLPAALRWDGKNGINKIAHGDYTSRYIAVGTTGQEMQVVGPAIYTDTLRPVISGFAVEESSAMLDREFRIRAKATDDFSGIGSAQLTWTLGDAVSGAILLSVDSSGNVDYSLYMPRRYLAQCAGCNLKISLRVEDKGHNWSEQEWQSSRLWPYPADLALWYPAQEGGGRTAKEYTGTGHDLDLRMPDPWLSASGIYFEKSTDNAPGKGQVSLGKADSYTLEAWIRPGHLESSSWSRILGFSFADGRRVDLQVKKDGELRLLDGTQAWAAPGGLLSQPKMWSHLAVSVDGDYARFYVDGQLAASAAAAPSERMWLGSFSLGMDEYAPSFSGHLMQVRMYKRALAEGEVHALFTGAGLGDGSRAEIVLAGELDWKADGVGRGFSCAVPGSSYWETSKESTVSWKAWVDHGAAYRIFLYARSAQPGSKAVKAGVSGALASGTASLESVWRSVALQGISLPLRAGFNDIELRLPAGMDVAGIAISEDPGLLPSQISWKPENSTANSPVVAAQVRFEGHPDPSMIRPRLRLQNIGYSTIYGPKVRYYFRGEDPAQVMASKFYPQEGELIVRQEGTNLGYAEWSFPETTALPSGQLLFWGEGPHFGLHNTSYVPWVVKDDPSFAEGSSNSFVDAPGIIVLDSDNKILSGSCFENEHPLNTTPAVQVFARDSRAGDSQASQLYIRLENIGQVPIRDYEVRYSFYVPGNAVPVLDVYDMQGLSASLRNLGAGRWQVAISGSASLGPGISWANPAQFALHLPNWQSGWDAGDDPSYEGLSAEWALAKGVEVFDASGNKIYGKEPSWPTEIANSSSSGSSPGYGQSSAQIRVMAKQTKAGEPNASAVRFYAENLGTESIGGFEIRYWFSASQGKQIGYQVHSNTQFYSDVVNEGGSLYSGRFVYTGGALAPGEKTEWGEGLEFMFHHSDWSLWDKESDFSNKGLEEGFSEARYMAAYDSKGNLIWGTEPVIPSLSSPAIGITLLPEGLLVTLLESSQIRMDLVNAAGIPQKFIYQGTLGAGTNIIPLDWSTMDITKTYLAVRINGNIATSLLSNLGN